MKRGLALFASLLYAGIASAQSPDAALVAAAKKEGEVLVYHSSQSKDLQPVFDAFSKKYGIKVTEWRSSSENVVQRTIREARAGRHTVDMIENNLPEMEALHREKLLQPVDTPIYAQLTRGIVPAHHEYATSTLDVFVLAYNTQKVKKEDLPRTYEDLLDPRWKGKIGAEVDDEGWFGTLTQQLGGEKGVKLFRDIADKNGITVRKGHTLLAKLVASGEVALALDVYSYKPPQLKRKGEPIDWFTMDPIIVQMHGVAVVKDAPHPNAGRLLHDFFLTEGQPLLAKKDFTPSNRNVPSMFDGKKLHPVDPAEAIDKDEQWLKVYQENVTRRSGA
ncbi:MAG TPA: extracellular solute-binding protein [Usitatibacter sp.]|nr:extracellular solute-binding protein [Usitatibacter sp.]